MAAVADDIFKGIFFKENIGILIQISLKFISKDLVNDKSTLL